jgi:hypothetical protein
MPNQENCTLEELDTAVKAAPIQRTTLRLMAIKALSMGLSLKHAAALFSVNEDSVSRWVRRFNERGIDGITEGPRGDDLSPCFSPLNPIERLWLILKAHWFSGF